jgi:hypothetical protein
MKTKTRSLHSEAPVTCLCLAILFLTTVGCGDSGPKLVTVKGTVTVGGAEPFANGTVRFTPKTPGKITTSYGKTDDDGNFTLINQSQRKGAEPGEYNVSFSLMKLRDGTPMTEGNLGNDEEDTPLEKRPVEFVPGDYSNFSSVKFPTAIPSSGGTFNFDIPKLMSVEEVNSGPSAPAAAGRRRR